MSDQPSGIDVMRRRIERASRRPPPAPRAPALAAAAPDAVAPGAVGEAAAPPASRPRRAPARPRLAPDLPPVNLAIRVRKPLDDRLADLIHALRGAGVRTSKVELIEMLLWEASTLDAAGARARLRLFREAAPRGAGARID